MRIATITNWAYGATVCLTIASGVVMLMASNADVVHTYGALMSDNAEAQRQAARLKRRRFSMSLFVARNSSTSLAKSWACFFSAGMVSSPW